MSEPEDLRITCEGCQARLEPGSSRCEACGLDMGFGRHYLPKEVLIGGVLGFIFACIAFGLVVTSGYKPGSEIPFVVGAPLALSVLLAIDMHRNPGWRSEGERNLIAAAFGFTLVGALSIPLILLTILWAVAGH